jgi:protoheme IX farnesyltransferase
MTVIASEQQVLQNNILDSRVRDFFALLKPRVMSLVVFTGLTGIFLAPGTLHPALIFLAICCIALGSGAAGAFNMWYDRDIDAKMSRTINRPIPTGRIAPETALEFSIIMASASVFIMALATNYIAALWLFIAIIFYGGIYTIWLKRLTPQNIVIGGAAGAFPPVIGWAAISSDFAFAPWILFLIIFLWTPPHFWALALYRAEEYARAGIPMMPVVKGQKTTLRQMFFYSIALFIVSILPIALGFLGFFYTIIASTIGIRFIFLCWKLMKKYEERRAKQLFGFSIFYLFALFSAMLIDHAL